MRVSPWAARCAGGAPRGSCDTSGSGGAAHLLPAFPLAVQGMARALEQPPKHRDQFLGWGQEQGHCHLQSLPSTVCRWDRRAHQRGSEAASWDCVAFMLSPSQGETSVETNTTEPEWNEQISFIEMFPPLARKIKVQVLDDANVGEVAIATHYIDLQQISDPGRNGEAWHGRVSWAAPCSAMVVSWRWEGGEAEARSHPCVLGEGLSAAAPCGVIKTLSLLLQALTPHLAQPG